jgi:pimeloyl-ACP methyl ester carboxylesterase
MPPTDAQTGYALVDDLSMYYEIHGRGSPLILLHGAFMTIDMMGPILAGLAATRQVTAVEQQGHGRTADIDRPLTYQQMADDTSALMRHLQISNADIVGYSMGGGIALQTRDPPSRPGAQARGRIRVLHQRRHARRGA